MVEDFQILKSILTPTENELMAAPQQFEEIECFANPRSSSTKSLSSSKSPSGFGFGTAAAVTAAAGVTAAVVVSSSWRASGSKTPAEVKPTETQAGNQPDSQGEAHSGKPTPASTPSSASTPGVTKPASPALAKPTPASTPSSASTPDVTKPNPGSTPALAKPTPASTPATPASTPATSGSTPSSESGEDSSASFASSAPKGTSLVVPTKSAQSASGDAAIETGKYKSIVVSKFTFHQSHKPCNKAEVEICLKDDLKILGTPDFQKSKTHSFAEAFQQSGLKKEDCTFVIPVDVKGDPSAAGKSILNHIQGHETFNEFVESMNGKTHFVPKGAPWQENYAAYLVEKDSVRLIIVVGEIKKEAKATLKSRAEMVMEAASVANKTLVYTCFGTGLGIADNEDPSSLKAMHLHVIGKHIEEQKTKFATYLHTYEPLGKKAESEFQRRTIENCTDQNLRDLGLLE